MTVSQSHGDTRAGQHPGSVWAPVPLPAAVQPLEGLSPCTSFSHERDPGAPAMGSGPSPTPYKSILAS